MKTYIISTMQWLPYHHDWKLAFQGEWGWRVHWFGRYAGYPDWHVEKSRLAPDMIQFFFVEKGSCWARVNGCKLTLKVGDLLVISGADEFSLGHDARHPHTSTSAALALSQRGVANVLLQRVYPRRYIAEFDRVLAVMSGAASPFRDLAISGALSQWLTYILDTLQPTLRAEAGERSVVDRLLSAQAWADARMGQVVTLAAWAASVRLNPIYFGRIFKRETGLKPMLWLNQRRLEMAAQYLSSTNKSVAEIAAECGYGSPFYFSRQFRRHYGLAPLRYRKTSFKSKRL